MLWAAMSGVVMTLITLSLALAALATESDLGNSLRTGGFFTVAALAMVFVVATIAPAASIFVKPDAEQLNKD